MMDFPFISLGPTIHLVALGVLFALVVVGIGVAMVLAALPGRIAATRNHPQAAAVNICGWLGLPTGVLWVAAMVWAHWQPSNESTQELNNQLNRLDTAISLLEHQRKKSVS